MVTDQTLLQLRLPVVSVPVSFASVRRSSQRITQPPEARSRTAPTRGERSAADLESGHTLSFFPYGDYVLLRDWTVEVGHPNADPRYRHLEDLGTDDDQVPRRALELPASPRSTRILRDIAAGTYEGNISCNKFHPLALDQADQEPGGPQPSA